MLTLKGVGFFRHLFTHGFYMAFCLEVRVQPDNSFLVSVETCLQARVCDFDQKRDEYLVNQKYAEF